MRGFYHWKSVFQLTSEQYKIFPPDAPAYLYVKYMDVVYQEGVGPIPVAKTVFSADTLPRHIQWVPCIFIVPEVFEKVTDPNDAALLARQIVDWIKAKTPAGIPVKELQFDCDWTEGTRVAYFQFLRAVRALLSEKTALSATIRLHQVKYRHKTGIPPVDRGVLMMYNFENPTRTDIQNSISDPAIARAYLRRQSPYPLPLDIALPLFGWGLHFREQQFQGFLHHWRPEQAKSASFLTHIEKNIYRVSADTTVAGTYFRSADWVRIESPTEAEINALLRQALPVLANDTCRVLFFDISEPNLFYYNQHFLHEITSNPD